MEADRSKLDVAVEMIRRAWKLRIRPGSSPNNLFEASPALVNHHNTDGTRSVFLLAWEHAAKVHKFPESPKSPCKIPCLSGFQVGHPLGNVKTAEVRTAVEGISTVKAATETIWYDLNGRRLSSPPVNPGIYIVRYTDGTTRKIKI